MAIFFLMVGLELKRELIRGELSQLKIASLPVAAAFGGMLVPALIFMMFNAGSAGFRGWAIPMATDIALAVGVLALLGKRIPLSIRLFLLTLAIVDDIAAVVVVAVFYSSGVNMYLLLLAAAIAAALVLLQKRNLLTMPLFVSSGVLLWLVINASGVHASIAGALVGLLAPVTAAALHKESLAERLERFTIPGSTLFVVPLFAFANTGIILSLDSFQHDSALPIAGGIIAGLVAGKVVGIVGASWLAVRLGVASLPAHANWNHIVGAGLLAGIGFTVSIFVTELAFTEQHFIDISKLSIFLASVVSAILGLLVLKHTTPKSQT